MPETEASRQTLEYLLTQGRIERVEPSVRGAESLLGQARLHLTSAKALSVTPDLALAFVAAYDAARKSLTAVLLVQGLRARGGDGGHAVLLDVVRLQFPDERRKLQRFDWLRTVRNSTEYPDVDTPDVTARDVTDAITAAQAILQVVELYFLSSTAGEATWDSD